MLKKRCGLFLGLVVLAGSACVTPTHASSAQNVIITYVQAGGSSSAKEELVVLYNPSPIAVDVTGWCLTNKSATNAKFACLSFSSPSELVTAILPAYSYLTIASRDYVASHNHPDDFYSLIYTVTNQSSGSITGGSDSVSLVTSDGEVVDNRAWTTSLAGGKAWVRLKLMSEPDLYATNNTSSDWLPSSQAASEPPEATLIFEIIPIEEEDVPPSENAVVPSQQLLSPFITELLANPKGVDAGKEFIELYNPSLTDVISLDDILLRVGFDKPRWYTFPDGVSILPQSYSVFYNAEMGFTLPNTTGKIQLFRNDKPIGDPIEYATAKDDQAWALIGATWQYTSSLTPGAPNQPSPLKASKVKPASTRKPCASNQYRNPATGRCKLISSTTAKPCASNQFRNPATGRCKLISSSTSKLKPCKANQERNPETNRCRNVSKMSDANYKPSGVETTANNQTRWYYWVAIAGIISLIIGYGVWEWRDELKALVRRAHGLLSRKTGLY